MSVSTIPKLSAYMTNFNHGQYIRQAIEAVVTQSRPPDEYLIIDDASTDNSVEIIEAFARRYSFIRFERNERNCGVVANCSRLLEMATGDYLYGGAADDFVLPGFFEKAMAMASQFPQAGIIFGKVALVNADGSPTGGVGQSSRWTSSCFASPDVFLREYLEAEHPLHSLSVATIFRTKCLRDIGGYSPELASWSDTFAINAIALKYGACYIPEVFAFFRDLPGSFSNTQVNSVTPLIEMVRQAAQLMRSPEFRAIFPEPYVAWWEKAYPTSLVRHHLHRVCALAQSGRFGSWIGCLKRNGFVGPLGRALERAWFKALVEREKWRLRLHARGISLHAVNDSARGAKTV